MVLLVTAPATTPLALGDRLAGLLFLPYALLDRATRVLPGGLVTFGIDSRISGLEPLGLGVADTAKRRASAVLADPRLRSSAKSCYHR